MRFKNTFIYEIYTEPFQGGILGVFIGMVIWVFTLGFLVLLFSGIFHVINYAGIDEKEAIFYVDGKRYVPPSTHTNVYFVGKVPMSSVVHDPEEYIVSVHNRLGNDNVCVSHKTYNNINIGDIIVCSYKLGRFSNELNITEIK